jgi:XTP/dITP diphosphohydrolase
MLSGEAGEPGRPGAEAGEPGIPGAALLNLVAVMDRLRRECPWDARQTHESLAPFLLEETYEAVEALEQRDLAKLREELGDVLLQVLFHARVAAERTDGTGFTIDDVADGIADKLIRRHPHVFADVTVTGPDEVKLNWDAIKARERAAAGGPVSALDGVPMGQPALSLAAQLQRRAERAGVPAELASLPVRSSAGSVSAESGLAPAAPAVPGGESVSPVAAELFELVARARAAGLDPELELRHASTVYRDLVRSWEQQESG